jgi:calcium-translocating P-type ATPase
MDGLATGEPEPSVSAAYALAIHQVEQRLQTGPRGLAADEAERRLRRQGPNRLHEAPPTHPLVIVAHQFRSPLIYILLVAAVITVAIEHYVDAVVITAVLLLNAVIGFAQEHQAERSVRALMQFLSPRATVIRDGRPLEIESVELVAGDYVSLATGQRVPADIRLVQAVALAVDNSLLTGESDVVSRSTEPLPLSTGLADRHDMAYMGTVVARGRGYGYVVATGTQTELGRIAEVVQRAKDPPTPLEQRMSRFARVVGASVALSAGLAILIGVAIGQPLADMFLVGVALAVSAVPEGLPIVLTIALSRGVRRMAQRRAIIRRLPAVETIGSATVVGSDKTGTLTENKMTVLEIWSGGRLHHLGDRGDPARVHRHSPLGMTLLTGVLTNEAMLHVEDGRFEVHGDPTEAALLVSAARLGLDPAALRADHVLIDELPFEPERRYTASICDDSGSRRLYVKGAPERVVAMCATMLTDHGPVPVQPQLVQAAANDMASHSLRVLAMAYRPINGSPATNEQSMHHPQRLTFLGLQGMMDPPRAGAAEAIAGCSSAGVRVMMITGDHSSTALAIGRRLGIAGSTAGVVGGQDLDALSDTDLVSVAAEASIYARVSPEQKLRIVRALQQRGEVVAVTGDGVNDAPALKAAEIGIAMGQSGTDVAREAADMVLADDDFASIFGAIQEGRVAFDNVRKTTFFLISTGAAEIVVILTALLAGWPLPFLPAQILWLNLVTNGLQDVALAFEPGEEEVLRRSPRPPSEGVLSRALWERTAVAGLVMAAGTLFMFDWTLRQAGSLAVAQTVALTTMVVFQAYQALNARSETRSVLRMNPLSNRFLLVAVVGSMAVHIAALYLPITQFVLRVEPIPAESWLAVVVLPLTLVAAMELHKLVVRRRVASNV